MSNDLYTPWAEAVVNQEDENGPKVETSATFTSAKISAGATKSRLPYPTFNKIINRTDRAVNALIDRGAGMYGGSGSLETEMIEGRLSDDWVGWSAGSKNRCYLNSASAKPLQHWPCRIDGHPYVLIADFYIAQLTIVDAETMVRTTVDLSSQLPAPVGTWRPIGVCASLDAAYVVFEDDNGGSYSGDIIIQAFNTTTWAKKWVSAYTAASSFGSGGTYIEFGIADANYLYFCFNDVDDTIRLISRTDGSVFFNGTPYGCTSSALISSVCSNGTYLFWGMDDSGNKIAQGLISNLASNPGGMNWPLTGMPVVPYCSACMGDLVAFAVGGNIIKIATRQNAYLCNINVSAILTGVYAVKFEGLYLWGRGFKTIGSTSRQILVRIPINRITTESGSADTTVTIAANDAMIFAFDNYLTHPTSAGSRGEFTHNGRDLFFLGDRGNTNAISPYLFRVAFSRYL